MATEIVTRHWCDVCLATRGEKVEANNPVTVALDAMVREVDLCEPCGEIYLTRLIELMQYGAEPEKPHRPRAPELREPTRRADAMKCGVCGGSYADRKSLRAHLRNVHQLTGLAAQRYLPDSARARPVACPECGNEYGSPAGLGQHRKSQHGVTGTSRTAINARGAA
jgi:hypothetical protein